ncbi:TRAP transporter small permease [Enterovibrio norvegicus]|uniref:TRAP transporter small permease n=1 Tax=Enterovibrio norvegicus TaxID=188144 RepID=UPI00352F7A16
MNKKLFDTLRHISLVLLYAGAAVILVQAAWISYGVVVRYIFNSPDGMVTEATALLLVPVAFMGVSFALLNDSYPKVTLVRDKLPPHIQFWVDKFNMFVMLIIGLFFLAASGKAMLKSFSSGAASEILLWPRFYFWIPVVIALLSFSITAFCLLVAGRHDQSTPPLQDKSSPQDKPSSNDDVNSIEPVEKH